MTKQETAEGAEMSNVIRALKPYKPDPKKFDSYIEWKQANVTGTYADYKRATV